MRELGADGRRLAEETWPKNAPLWGEAPLFDADAIESKLVPLLEPLPDDEDAGVCSRAAVMSPRKPVSTVPLVSARGAGCGVVKGALFAPAETKDAPKFMLSLNRRTGERRSSERWVAADGREGTPLEAGVDG